MWVVMIGGPRGRKEACERPHLRWGRLLYTPLLMILVCLATVTASAQDKTEELLARGAAIAEDRFCRVCHQIGDEGTMVGPNLNQVTQRRTEDWLRAWLTGPAKMKPGTLMPMYPWTEEELDAILAYLSQYGQPIDGPSILAAEGKGPSAGEALVKAYQCWACHKVVDQTGRPIYPDLSTVKERRTRDWEKTWLADPQKVTPGTFMPSFGFSEAEIEAITEYLYQ